jgi:hypothetical protein
MKRPVEERRRLLKTLLAGGAAVTAATALPASWKKPLVDSVMTPVHAQGSAPSFIQTVSVAYTITGPQGLSSTVTPATTPKTHLFNTNYLYEHDYSFVPSLTVQPGITDSFTLTVNETIAGGDATNFTPTTQNQTPSVNTGVVPFNAVTGSVDNAKYAQYQITITPSNPSFQTYYLQVTLDEAPAGSGAGLP